MKLSAPAIRVTGALFACILTLNACSIFGKSDDDTAYPKTEEDRRKDRVGKMTGDEGITLGGVKDDKKNEAGKNPLGVNSFLWRATLDTLAFLPLASADPFGGVILTDWYEDAQAPGERFKVNALILDRQLRADSLKITVFRQKKDARSNQWNDTPNDPVLSRKLEDTILTRARQMRVAQLGR